MDFFITHIHSTLNDPVLFFSIAFVALLFFGEPVILSIALLSATTPFITPEALIVLAITTAVVAECFWFFVSTSFFAKRALKKNAVAKGFHELQFLREKFNVRHPLALLFVTRPFTGLTVIAIILLGKEGVPWGRFVLYSTIVNVFWTPIVIGIGYATGKGYTWALTLFEGIHFGLGTILVLLVIVFFVYKYATQRLTHIAFDLGER